MALTFTNDWRIRKPIHSVQDQFTLRTQVSSTVYSKLSTMEIMDGLISSAARKVCSVHLSVEDDSTVSSPSNEYTLQRLVLTISKPQHHK